MYNTVYVLYLYNNAGYITEHVHMYIQSKEKKKSNHMSATDLFTYQILKFKYIVL